MASNNVFSFIYGLSYTPHLIIGRVEWLGENIEDANMGPILRSRKDVRSNLTWVQADFR
jgi:hypothetical protein